MSRKSGLFLLAQTSIALAISSGVAAASPLGNFSIAIQSAVVEAAALSCPPGTHVGYEGKYCWPNRPRACPAGYHLGYEGKYCWAND
ncbi:hypothetical protein [Bradyrhizobium acaciae]|uniref:hypothetical protein n=1 Tax=Bradyrhizobium acaciae TaxID=2683706 RepID=UPI001E4CE2B9|nr:hypothetical protein [Bradyrhizobium acaciae]MCC8982144.1 hypothetical protein [Bradyrhizobium acaciae]